MNPVQAVVEQGINEGVFPGAAYAVHCDGKTKFGFAGNHTYCPESIKISADTIFDLASVSKVISTTSAAMLLVQRGLLDLAKPVSSVIPEFRDKDQITFHHLLAHDSGLIAFRPFHKTHTTPETVMQAIYEEGLTYPTGSKTVYSDLNMILLAEVIRRLTSLSLDQFSKKEIFEPLGLKDTGYFIYEQTTLLREKCAPTERMEDWRVKLRRRRLGDIGSQRIFGINPEYVQGEVHDPTATVLGGVAGHAGLFSTIGNLVEFMRNFTSEKPKLFDVGVRDLFTTRFSEKSTRALGWDTKSETGSSAGQFFGNRSYGHTGYTGTSVWVDPDRGLFAILLTNRVHPTSENTKILSFRPRYHDVVAKNC
jgi:CubicO group peptidase (beta-lactamase class C family)